MAKIITIKVARPKSRGTPVPPSQKHGSPKGLRGYNRANAKAELRRNEE